MCYRQHFITTPELDQPDPPTSQRPAHSEARYRELCSTFISHQIYITFQEIYVLALRKISDDTYLHDENWRPTVLSNIDVKTCVYVCILDVED